MVTSRLEAEATDPTELRVEPPPRIVRTRAEDDELWTVLRADVSARIAQSLTVFGTACRLALPWSATSDAPDDVLRQLESDQRSVRLLELRMPIVAPMKSGKSTVINAVVGYRLLPTRAAAMTTMPTKIVLVEDLAEPELTLSSDDVAAFRDLASALQVEVVARFDELSDRYADSEQLLIDVRDGRTPRIQDRWTGHEAVLRGLTLLNDLVRLAAVVRQRDDVMERMVELPTLRTPYLLRPELADTQGIGTLSLIDTPGPDESGVTERLTGAVAAQLKNSHVILLLLDYTSMGNQAGQTVRELIDPVVEQLGREKLFVVVNKVDQRKPGDRDAQAIRRFVQRDLQLVDAGAEHRIFETTGHRALAAARAQHACVALEPAAPLPPGPEVKDFLAELFVLAGDQRRYAQEWTVADLRRAAEEVWQASGLPALLEHAVGRLRSEAVPMVLTSALARLGPHLRSLAEVTRLRLDAARGERATVKAELAHLGEEAATLTALRKDAPDREEIDDRMRRALEEVVCATRTWGWNAIAQYQADVTDYRDAREVSADLVEFGDADQARDFIDRMTGEVAGRLRRALVTARGQLNETVQALGGTVVREQEQKVRPVLERAVRRLSDAFELSLEIPSLRSEDDDIEVDPPLPTITTRQEERVRNRVEMKRRWFTAFFVKRPVNITERYVAELEVYQVELTAIREALGEALEERMGRLDGELRSHLVDRLSRTLDQFFNDVEAYLDRYRVSLEQAQQDAAASEAGKARTAAQLEQLRAEVGELVEAVETLTAQVAG